MGPSVTDRISGAALGTVAATVLEPRRDFAADVPWQAASTLRDFLRVDHDHQITDRQEDSAALCKALRISTFGPWCNR